MYSFLWEPLVQYFIMRIVTIAKQENNEAWYSHAVQSLSQVHSYRCIRIFLSIPSFITHSLHRGLAPRVSHIFKIL
jgi:hypothetical protein